MLRSLGCLDRVIVAAAFAAFSAFQLVAGFAIERCFSFACLANGACSRRVGESKACSTSRYHVDEAGVSVETQKKVERFLKRNSILFPHATYVLSLLFVVFVFVSKTN